ncbi:MAG: hypothetical protein HZB38_11945 [Planctomycetes bacterium]|nr:hypothetical protein [Planctomycetota bacterium]
MKRANFAVRTVCVLSYVIGASLSTESAFATGLSWSNAAGGSASIATNWTPNQVPTSADDLTFNLAGSYAVTFNSSTTASRTQTFRQGTVTLTMSSPHTTSNGVAIGDLAGDVSVVTLTTGRWSSGPAGFVNIGDAAGSTGTLNVNDDDADFLVTGTSDLFVGNNGTGTLNITGVGTVTLNDAIFVGQGSAASGHLTVSGFLASPPFGVSTLQSSGTGQSRFGNGGDATVSIANGALAHFAGDLVIANLSTSASNVTVQGPGLVADATLDVDGDLLLGSNTSAGIAAGAETLVANADSRVLVGGTLFVAGDPDGGTATLHSSTGGLVSANSLSIGNGATLDLDGGAIDIDGGTLSWTNTASSPRFNGGIGNPVITMKNDATATLTPTAGGLALVVGGGTGANLCDFDVRFGADLTTTGSVTLGEGSDDYGGMIISGAGSTMTMPVGSTLTVGSAGDGRFEGELGGSVSGDKLAIAAGATSAANVIVENPLTTATFRDVYVGGSSGGPGGDGHLIVNAGGALSLPDSGLSMVIWSTGLVDVQQADGPNATMSCQGVLEIEDGGTVNMDAVGAQPPGIIRGPNDIPGAGTINANIVLFGGTTLELVNGDLTVGDSTDTNGFIADDGSLVSVGAHTLTLNDADRAKVDTVTINGGQIVAPNGLEIVTPGTNGTLTGTGTITTSDLFMDSGGSVITATGAAGITITGKFRNNSGMIDGTKYTFNNNPAIADSGWTGAGTIDAQVVFNSGTKVRALANMTMGDGSNFGVTFNVGSEMHADTRTITLLDGNGVGLPSITDLSGGHVVCTQPLTVNSGRRLSGRGGSIDSPTVSVFGRLSPGELIGVPVGETGELTINGNLTLGATADTDIEIQGLLGPVEYDRVVVNGVATLGGDLNVNFLNGFVPPIGSVWTVMTYNSKVGDFANINVAPGSPSCVFVAVSDRSVVVTRGLPGDLDDEGDVDISDLALLLSNFGCHGAVEFPCPIDLDLNGDTDISDLAILLSNFGQTCS